MKRSLTEKEKAILDFSFYPYLYRLSEEVKRREILDFLKGAQKGVDLGCGSGWLAVCLAKKGLMVTAVDLSKAALDSAHFLFKKEKLKIPLVKASAVKLPFPKNYFDFFICCEVLEHIPQPQRALREISRCLKGDGKLCLSLPNGWTFGLIYDRFLLRLFTNSFHLGGGTVAKLGCAKESALALKKIGIKTPMVGYGHVNQFSIFSIKKLLKASGFEVIKVQNLEIFLPYLFTLFTGLLKIERRKLRVFEKIDQWLVRLTPSFLASNWLILCQKK